MQRRCAVTSAAIANLETLPPRVGPSEPVIADSKPLVTLMKQARAFGVGVVVATQNPMDLDYRAASNAGLWSAANGGRSAASGRGHTVGAWRR